MDEEKKFRGHKDLIVWQKAMLFVYKIYKTTSTFPDSEKYSLTSQIRRAVLSVPANIAEGYARCSTKELSRFLLISNGSLAEIETFMEIAHNLGYIKQSELINLNQDHNEIRKMLWSLIKHNSK